MVNPNVPPPGTDVPAIYVDAYTLEASPYTISLNLGVKRPDGETQWLARVQMSPQHAKLMAYLFQRAMREVEKQLGGISVPKQVLESMQIPQDDWTL